MRGHGSGPGGRGWLVRRPRRKRNKKKDKKANASDENEDIIVTSRAPALKQLLKLKDDTLKDDRPSSEQFAFSAHPLAPCASSKSYFAFN